MNSSENYVYKKEVDWSLLHYGITLPVDVQVIFGQYMSNFISRGESNEISLYLEGKSYKAALYNVNFDQKHNRKKDTYQIRYSASSELAQSLRAYYNKSYSYIKQMRDIRASADQGMIRLPDNYKDYLAIYTTEYEDTYVLEIILADELSALRALAKSKQEQELEFIFENTFDDHDAELLERYQIAKIRKLNRKIGENLKLFYANRCQICGSPVGDIYDTSISEAHHIDYFVNSQNNNSSNLMILCPNHHRVIHNTNPEFDKKQLVYLYPNGYKEQLQLNSHL